MRSAAAHEIPLVVLGWDPLSTPRHLEFYLGSKLVMLLAFLEEHVLRDDAVLIFTDGTDTLVQAGAPQLLARARALLRRQQRGQNRRPRSIRRGQEGQQPDPEDPADGPAAAEGSAGAVVFAAEAYAFPPSFASFYDGEFDRWRQQRREGRGSHLFQRRPLFKYLNTGGFVGRPAALRSLLRAYLHQADRANDPRPPQPRNATARTVHSLRTSYIAALPRVYFQNDQAVMSELYRSVRRQQGVGRERAAAESGRDPVAPLSLGLDYETRLFLPIFSTTPKANLAVSPSGMLTNCVSNTTPGIVHFNGIKNARPWWMEGYESQTLECYRRRHANSTRSSASLRPSSAFFRSSHASFFACRCARLSAASRASTYAARRASKSSASHSRRSSDSCFL